MTNDLENARSTNLLFIYQPSMQYEPKIYEAKGKTDKMLLEFYTNYQLQVLASLRDYDLTATGVASTDAVLMADTNMKMTFETKLAKILQNPEDITLEQEAKKITFKQFRDIVQGTEDEDAEHLVNIVDVIVETVRELAGYELEDDTVISCPFPEYFGKIQALLDEADPRDVLNYLMMRHIMDMAPATTAEMRAYELQFKSIRTGVINPPPRYLL